MTKELWINLAVKNIEASRTFFRNIGFTLHHENNPNMCAVAVGEQKVMVMLFPEAQLKQFMQNELPNTSSSNEVMLSFDVSSREEVDEVARRVEAAGGIVFGKPSDIQGWMYGCGFTDLDGHRWNALYMDMSKMPK